MSLEFLKLATHFIIDKQGDDYLFCHGTNDLQNQVPLESFGLEEPNGVYNKEPLSCNGNSETNISELVKIP